MWKIVPYIDPSKLDRSLQAISYASLRSAYRGVTRVLLRKALKNEKFVTLF